MIEKVKEYIEQNQMIARGDTIILGISGGADSVCLFFVLLELQKSYDFRFIGVHVNHNLRGEAAQKDQEYVEAICSEYEVECVIFSVDVEQESKKRRKSLEETGREVRQEAFAQVMMKEAQLQNAEQLDQTMSRIKIATAHHGNDNAETFLMNLARGTGIEGLTGIAPVRGSYIRPLLCVQRQEIEEYLEENKKKYCIDATNHENIYIRNVIRNQVIPTLEDAVNTQTVSHIESVVEELSKVEAYLQEQVANKWKACVREESGIGIILVQEQMKAFPEILQEKMVKKALEKAAGKQRDLTRTHVAQILGLFQKQVGKEIHLPYDVIGVRVYEGICLRHRTQNNENVGDCDKVELTMIHLSEMGTNVGNVEEEFQDTPYTKYFDYDIIDGNLGVRTRQIGDYLILNQSGNRQSLKKYYITNKIPSALRDAIPLVVRDHEVLWIVGHRKCCGYEITEKTKQVLKVQYNGGNYGRIS